MRCTRIEDEVRRVHKDVVRAAAAAGEDRGAHLERGWGRRVPLLVPWNTPQRRDRGVDRAVQNIYEIARGITDLRAACDAETCLQATIVQATRVADENTPVSVLD